MKLSHAQHRVWHTALVNAQVAPWVAAGPVGLVSSPGPSRTQRRICKVAHKLGAQQPGEPSRFGGRNEQNHLAGSGDSETQSSGDGSGSWEEQQHPHLRSVHLHPQQGGASARFSM